jgi:hypothetical protein
MFEMMCELKMIFFNISAEYLTYPLVN